MRVEILYYTIVSFTQYKPSNTRLGPKRLILISERRQTLPLKAFQHDVEMFFPVIRGILKKQWHKIDIKEADILLGMNGKNIFRLKVQVRSSMALEL